MLNLCPYNGGPDVEFSELILQFSHHFYFSFFIIKTLPTPPPPFFWTTQQGITHQGSNLCPLQWKHRALITREFPRLYFFKKLSLFYLFICIFGCVGSLLLHELFSSCGEWGLLSRCGVQVSRCGRWLFSVVAHRP